MVHVIPSTQRASQVTQRVKNPPAMQETQVRFLRQEDPLKEGMAVHSSILAWRIPWTEESGGLQSLELKRVGYNWATKHACTQSCKKDVLTRTTLLSQPQYILTPQRQHISPKSQNIINVCWEFLGSSLFRTLCFYCRGHSFDHGSGN